MKTDLFAQEASNALSLKYPSSLTRPLRYKTTINQCHAKRIPVAFANRVTAFRPQNSWRRRVIPAW